MTNPVKYIRPLSILFMLWALSLNSTGQQVDDIKDVFIYETDSTNYIILHELIFNPVEKTYQQGMLKAEGFSESRISVFNLSTGHLMAQKNMGIMDSTSACMVLGCYDNNLWIYWKKHRSGLQSIHPLTLERKISMATIYAEIQPAIGRFAEPKTANIPNKYGFDEINNRLIVTNSKNKQYYIALDSFNSSPVNSGITLNPEYNKYFNYTSQINGAGISFDGDDDAILHINNRPTIKDEVFLYGRLLMNQDRVSLYNYFKNRNKIENVNEEENINALLKGDQPESVLLKPENNSFLIYFKSDQGKDALMSLAKIKYSTPLVSVDWEINIPGMFFNVSQARDSKAFKKYYGDFPPESSFQYFNLVDDKLIIIHLLNMAVIDTKTGERNWQKKLN